MENTKELNNYFLRSAKEGFENKCYSSDNYFKVQDERIKNISVVCKKLYKEIHLDDILDYMFHEYDYDLNSSETDSERAVFMAGQVYLYMQGVEDSEKMNPHEKVKYYMNILNGKKQFYFLGETPAGQGQEDYYPFVLFDTEKDFYNYNKQNVTDDIFYIVHKNKIIYDESVLDACTNNTNKKLKASDLL